MNHATTIAAVSAVAAAATAALAGPSFTENFEAAAAGSFPASPWRDIGNSAVPAPAIPSGQVIDTLGPAGQPTRAFQVFQRDTTSQGLITPINPAPVHQIEADIRVDSHPTPAAFGDWTAAVGFFDESGPLIDINAEPQAVLYVYQQRWYFYGSTTPQNATNIPLGPTNVSAGDWYRVSLEADTSAGAFHVRVVNQAGVTEIDRTVAINGYTPAFGRYNRVAFFDGEYAVRSNAAGQFTVDNIRYIPAPASTAMLGGVGLALANRRRR
ncbi:MAG: hypothetical protein AAF297_02515 [Planctomycetota bacterium]